MLKKILILFSCFSGFLFSQFKNISGAELLQLGVSPYSVGTAGQISTEDRELDALSMNPLVAARHIYQNINLAYQGFGQVNAYTLGYVLPLAPGVFSVNVSGLLSDEYELNNYHSISIQFAKEVSTRFTFGTGLNVDIYPDASEVQGGVSLDLALLYKDLRKLKKTFGLGEGKYALLIRGLGLSPITKQFDALGENTGDKVWIEPIEIRGGLSVAFFRLKKEKMDWDMRLGLDIGMHAYPFNGFFNLAYKNFFVFPTSIFYGLGFNVGYMLNLESIGVPNLGPVTAGLSMKFRTGKDSKSLINFSYAFLPERINDDLGFLHTLSLNLEIGRRDESRPEIDIGELKESESVQAGKSLSEGFE